MIPIVADHFSIVAPRNQEADVYKNLLPFLAKASSGKHEDTSIADTIIDVGEVVERRTDEISSLRQVVLDVPLTLGAPASWLLLT